MAWLELTIETASAGIEDVAAALTAGGFSDLLLEDQQEFESFLEDWGADFAYHTAGNKQYRYMVQDTSQSLTSDGYTIYGEAIQFGKGAELHGNLDRTAVFKNATAIEIAEFLRKSLGSIGIGVDACGIPACTLAAHTVFKIDNGDNKVAVFCFGEILIPIAAFS